MYTGTLIRDLLATVERTERRIREKEERELQMLFEMQIPLMQDETVLVGAA